MNIDDKTLIDALYIELHSLKHEKKRVGDLSRKQILALIRTDTNKGEFFGAKTVLDAIDQRKLPLPKMIGALTLPEKDKGYEDFLDAVASKPLWNPGEVIRMLLRYGDRGGNHPIVHALEKDFEGTKSWGRNRIRFRFLKHWYHYSNLKFYDAQQEPELKRVTKLLKKDIEDKLIDPSSLHGL